ncbi:MAG: hypothetical protein AAGG06_00845 [Pseudomonadota bacterium]
MRAFALGLVVVAASAGPATASGQAIPDLLDVYERVGLVSEPSPAPIEVLAAELGEPLLAVDAEMAREAIRSVAQELGLHSYDATVHVFEVLSTALAPLFRDVIASVGNVGGETQCGSVASATMCQVAALNPKFEIATLAQTVERMEEVITASRLVAAALVLTDQRRPQRDGVTWEWPISGGEIEAEAEANDQFVSGHGVSRASVAYWDRAG